MGDRIVGDRDTGAYAADPATVALTEPTVALARPTGRHRMPPTLPARLLRRGIAPAWLERWWPTAAGWLQRWWISVASAALVAVTAVTVAVVVIGQDPERPASVPLADAIPATARPGSSDATPSATATPTTSAGPTPSRSRTPPLTPMDRLSGFASAVEAQINSGDLDSDAGRDLLRTLGGIAAAVQKGRNERAGQRLREVEKRLAELRRDGKLSPAGFDALNVVGPIIASLG